MSNHKEILGPVSRALGPSHGFGHLLDDKDERFIVLPRGIADLLGWCVRHFGGPPLGPLVYASPLA